MSAQSCSLETGIKCLYIQVITSPESLCSWLSCSPLRDSLQDLQVQPHKKAANQRSLKPTLQMPGSLTFTSRGHIREQPQIISEKYEVGLVLLHLRCYMQGKILLQTSC